MIDARTLDLVEYLLFFSKESPLSIILTFPSDGEGSESDGEEIVKRKRAKKIAIPDDESDYEVDVEKKSTSRGGKKSKVSTMKRPALPKNANIKETHALKHIIPTYSETEGTLLSPFYYLDQYTVKNIGTFLDSRSALTLSLVNRYLYQLLSLDEDLWKAFLYPSESRRNCNFQFGSVLPKSMYDTSLSLTERNGLEKFFGYRKIVIGLHEYKCSGCRVPGTLSFDYLTCSRVCRGCYTKREVEKPTDGTNPRLVSPFSVCNLTWCINSYLLTKQEILNNILVMPINTFRSFLRGGSNDSSAILNRNEAYKQSMKKWGSEEGLAAERRRRAAANQVKWEARVVNAKKEGKIKVPKKPKSVRKQEYVDKGWDLAIGLPGNYTHLLEQANKSQMEMVQFPRTLSFLRTLVLADKLNEGDEKWTLMGNWLGLDSDDMSGDMEYGDF